MIEQNVKNILSELPATNPFGEKLTLVAAIKLQSPENINRAIKAGITDVGDNHVQEFRDKYCEITGSPKRHFIGHLQTNKVKYLIGKIDLYHSLDRINLAEEISSRSLKAGIVSNVLLQVNIGCEPTKSGFMFEEAEHAYECVKKMPALKICGLMAMLPDTDDKDALRLLAAHMRNKYDILRAHDPNITCLSMGMSNDWQICIEEGANMIRLGTAVFGERNYNNK